MAWGTPSCSLSSMPVAPTRMRSCSISVYVCRSCALRLSSACATTKRKRHARSLQPDTTDTPAAGGPGVQVTIHTRLARSNFSDHVR